MEQSDSHSGLILFAWENEQKRRDVVVLTSPRACGDLNLRGGCQRAPQFRRNLVLRREGFYGLVSSGWLARCILSSCDFNFATSSRSVFVTTRS